MIYNLLATKNHQSTSKNQGHYYTISQQHDSGIWYEYDDERVKVANFTKTIQGICTMEVPLQRTASMLFYINKGPTSVDSNDLSGINGDENSTNSDERSLRLRFSDNDGDKNNIDSQKMQQASLHSNTNKQPSDLQGDGGTTAAELPPPRDNNLGEDNSSSSDDEESLFLASVIDLISVQQEEIGDVAMEVECDSVQQNRVPTEHLPVCACGMDARTTSYLENRYGEYCCLGIRMGQSPCNHNVCNAIVHPICHIN